MATIIHPQGVQVEIVGIDESNRGRSCCNHACCGKVLAYDSVVRFRICQIMNDLREEETAVEAVLVTGGLDSCRVGFLPRMYLPDMEDYHGKVAQVSFFMKNSRNPKEVAKNETYRGMCRVHVIDSEVVFGFDEAVDDDEVGSYDSSKDEEVDSPPRKRRPEKNINNNNKAT